MADTTSNMKKNREGGEGLISGRSGPSSSHSTDFAAGRQPENANRPPSPSLRENRRKYGIQYQESSTTKTETDETTRSREAVGSHPGASFSHQEGSHASESDTASGNSPGDRLTASVGDSDASLLLNRIKHSLTAFCRHEGQRSPSAMKGIVRLFRSSIRELILIKEEQDDHQKTIKELKSAVTNAENSVKQAESDLAELNKPREAVSLASTAPSQEMQAPHPDREDTASPRTIDTIKGDIENLRVLRDKIKEIPNLDKEHEKLKREISQLEEEVSKLRKAQDRVKLFYAQKPTNWNYMQELHQLYDMQEMIDILEHLKIPGLDLSLQKDLSMALDLSVKMIQEWTDCLPPSGGNLVEGVQHCLTTLEGILTPPRKRLSDLIDSCRSQEQEQISESSSIPPDFTFEPPDFSNLEEVYNSSYIERIKGQVKSTGDYIKKEIEEFSGDIDGHERTLESPDQQPSGEFIQRLEQDRNSLSIIAWQANKNCSRHCEIHTLLDYGLSEKVDRGEIEAYISLRIENAQGDINLKNSQIDKMEQEITETINNGLLENDATQIRDTTQMEQRIQEKIKNLQKEKNTLIEASRQARKSQARAKKKELRDATQLRDTKSDELKKASETAEKYAKKHEDEIKEIRSKIAPYLIEDR